MRRGLVPVLVVAALIAACSDDNGKSSAPSTTTSPAAAKRELVPSTCFFSPPATDHWDCSTLIVPADRTKPAGAHVLLPVAVLRSQAASVLPDPIVYFNGGPGDDTLINIAGFFAEQFGDGRRDVIIFDQRGTGGARPSLNCPESEDALRASLGTADETTVDVTRDLDAQRACRTRLAKQGVDLNDFDTPTTADDADDLRRALGYKQWNVIGLSYGTTVALEVARRYPDTIRSLVLDSVYPPDIIADGVRILDVASRAFTVYFDGCTHSTTCAASHPDPRAEFNALADSWDQQPFELDVDDPKGGDQKLHVRLTGDDLTSGLFQALYDTNIIPALPSVGTQIRKRDDAARALVATFVVDALRQSLYVSEGIASVVNCADRQRLPQPDFDVAAATAATPHLASFLNRTDGCPIWDVASVPKAFNTIPRSKVRLLALAGEYDPITPPADTKRVADRFAGSKYVFFPGHGHGQLFTDDCPRAVIKSFIDDPTAPDTSCVAKLGPPAFAAG